MSLEELSAILKKVVREELQASQKADQAEKFLSPEETCNLFQPKISKPTLESWQKRGFAIKYYIGGRTYYKYGEILESIKHISKYKIPG